MFLITVGFGSLYEIYEWLSDTCLGTEHQPDLVDTMVDMTANVLGGLVGGLWLAAWWARRA